MKHTKKTY